MLLNKFVLCDTFFLLDVGNVIVIFPIPYIVGRIELRTLSSYCGWTRCYVWFGRYRSSLGSQHLREWHLWFPTGLLGELAVTCFLQMETKLCSLCSNAWLLIVMRGGLCKYLTCCIPVYVWILNFLDLSRSFFWAEI
jgi:hypothetical protein